MTGDWSRGLDINVPNAARMDDYYLGGSHNFAIDREAAEQVLGAIPEMRRIAAANRAFLGRAVRYLLAHGVRQFLDIGAGIPTTGGVHQFTAAHPGVRVVYVDTDPVAVAHAIEVHRGNPHATALRADLGCPDAILTHYNTRTTLDLNQPVGLLLLCVLEYLEDAAAYPAVTGLLAALAPGSYLALTHTLYPALPLDQLEEVVDVYRRTDTPIRAHRDRDQIRRFLHGLNLIGPGLASADRWTPQAEDTAAEDNRDVLVAALGRTAV